MSNLNLVNENVPTDENERKAYYFKKYMLQTQGEKVGGLQHRQCRVLTEKLISFCMNRDNCEYLMEKLKTLLEEHKCFRYEDPHSYMKAVKKGKLSILTNFSDKQS